MPIRNGRERMSTGITRRGVLKTALVVGAAMSCARIDDGSGKGAAPEDGSSTASRDGFGGWTGKRFEATGFFRTEHDGQRWWLVTPEGNAFISFGINHYHAGWWAQDYNREHWVETFGATEPFDDAWWIGFRDTAVADFERLGLNTLGIHTDAPALTDPPHGPVMPYVRKYEPVVLSHYLNPPPETYVDLFALAFEAQCDAAAREMAAPYADDPMLLGYCMADCPILTDNDAEWFKGTTWPRILRNLGADSPGKRAWLETIRERHADIAAFNAAYSTDFSSWESLAAAEGWRPNAAPANPTERDDNHAFLRVCVDRYYSVARAALRRVDANHLFLGDKINGNTDTLDSILEVTGRYTDVVNVQFYARWAEQKPALDRWAALADLPLLNGDSAFTVPTETTPNPHGPHARDQAERAAWTREFMENALARPEFVGWHVCGIIDTSKEMPGKEAAQHQGLMTVTGEFYPEMEEAVKDLSARLYDIATSSQGRGEAR